MFGKPIPDYAMDAQRTDAFATYDRLRRALILAVVLALAGWVGLWFRWNERWIAFVVWGVGNGLGGILAITLALWRCPRCQRRGLRGKGCPHCGLVRDLTPR